MIQIIDKDGNVYGPGTISVTTVDGKPKILVVSTPTAWGSITGTLSSQTDLQSALDNKVDKVLGKQLSTEDYTTAEKSKLSGIAAGAEVNVNADWTAVSGDAQILNKPTIPTALADLTEDATHRTVTDVEKSTWNGKLDPNTPITGATKTKITYDADGLVTAGADATTADIADSLNKRYVTDAQLTVIGNTSGTNSGNETTSSIGTLINAAAAATPNDTDLVATTDASVLKKITWTNVKAFLKTYFDTLYQATGNYFNKTSDDTDDITVGATNKFATAAEKTKLGFITVTQAVDLDTIESDTATNNAKVSNATHTGDVTGSTALTIDKTAITGKTLVTGLGADYILISDTSDGGNLKKCLASDLAGSGGVSDGDKGDITVSSSGTVWTIDNLAVGDAKINDVAATKVTQDATHRFVSDTDLIKLSNTSGTNSGNETTATIQAKLGTASTSTSGYLTSTDWNTFNGKQPSGTYATGTGTANGTNTGDQTSIVGISGTKAQFDTACSDGNFVFVGDVVGVTDGDKGNITVSSSGATWLIDNSVVGISQLSATGTPSSSTFLRGDNTWATPTAADPAGWTTLVKSANQDVTNSASYVDDSSLQFSVVAGGHYMCEFDLVVSANNQTGDWRGRFNLSAGTMKGSGIATQISATSTAVVTYIVAANGNPATAFTVGTNLADIDLLASIKVIYSFYCSANATFSLQFANASAGIGNISRTWKGSILKYKRID